MASDTLLEEVENSQRTTECVEAGGASAGMLNVILLFASRRMMVLVVGVVAVAVALAIVADAAASGAALLAGLVVAIVTAEAANARQVRQLDAERDRQALQLDAERARLTEQLGAERKRARESADLKDLRDLLDETARAVHCGREACPSVAWLDQTEDHEVWREFGKNEDQLWAAYRQLQHVNVRLSIRLDREHEITVAVLAIRDAVAEIASGLGWFTPPGVHGEPEEDEEDIDSSMVRERVAKGRAALVRNQRAFEAAVIRVAGSRLMAESR